MAKRAKLFEIIEEERGNLCNVQALIHCMLKSMEHTDGEEPFQAPYYPAVVEIALKMMGRSIEALETLNLQRATGSERPPDRQAQ